MSLARLIVTCLIPLVGLAFSGGSVEAYVFDVESSEACDDPAALEALVEEISWRLPDATMRVNTPGLVEALVGITWLDTDAGCQLRFHHMGQFSFMTFEPGVSPDEIELAASRVVWITSIAIAGGERLPERFDLPEEEEGDVSEAAVEVEPLVEVLEDEDEEPDPPDVGPEEAMETEEQEEEYTLRSLQLLLSQRRAIPAYEQGERRRAKLSLNLIGETDSIRGVELGVANYTNDDAAGLQFALGMNSVAGLMHGFQIATGANFAGRLRGMQVAIGANILRDPGSGFQLAFLNSALGHQGLQVGLLNIGGVSEGAQVGLINISGTHQGVQAGLLNITRKSQGAQAGLVNLAGDHKGVQAGLANLASDVDVSVGLVSLATARPWHLHLRGEGRGAFMLAVEHGSRLLKWRLLGGLSGLDNLAAGGGLSFQLPFGPILLSLDYSMMQVAPVDNPEAMSHLQQPGLTVGYQFFERLVVYLGTTYNELWSSDATGRGAAPSRAHIETFPAGQTRQLTWIDGVLGVRF